MHVYCWGRGRNRFTALEYNRVGEQRTDLMQSALNLMRIGGALLWLHTQHFLNKIAQFLWNLMIEQVCWREVKQMRLGV